MPFVFYSVCVVVAALVAAVLLYRFAAPGRVGFLVLLTAWYAWLTSFSVVALVPVDVLTTLSGTGNVYAISILWKISYWSTQGLTWAVIPIQQGYVLSGAFTVMGRLRSAIRRLWRFWLIVGLLAGLGVVIAAVMGKLHVSTLPQLIVTLSNTYGLIAVIVLLGYGLVEVPRVLWRRSFPEDRLRWHLYRVGKAAHRLNDACNELERCLAVVVITSQQVPRSDAKLRRRADGLVAYAEGASPVHLSALPGSKLDVETLEERDLDYAGDAAGLARLRGRLKIAVAEFVGSRGEYLIYVKKAMELEAICKARQLGIYSDLQGGRMLKAIWWYKCVLRPYVHRLLALLAAGASGIIIWCETTIGTGRSPDLSPFSLAVHNPTFIASPFLEQFAVAAPLAYVAAATYFSLFKLGSLGPYHMVHRATWSWSLLLNGQQYNGQSMVFVGLMGLEEVPLLGTGFNTWFPVLMILYVALLLTNTCGACMAKVLPSQLRFAGENIEADVALRGQELLQAEKDVIDAGAVLGEGTQMFGMVRPSAQTSKNSYSSRKTQELQLGGGGSDPGSSSMRRPLFEVGEPHSDDLSWQTSRDLRAVDAADQLFEAVEKSSWRTRR